MGIRDHEPTVLAIHPGASPTTGYPRVNDPVPPDRTVMHAVGPTYIIDHTTISPDRFIATTKNPGISFTAIPPNNYEAPGWPNGNDSERRQQAAQRLPPFSQAPSCLLRHPPQSPTPWLPSGSHPGLYSSPHRTTRSTRNCTTCRQATTRRRLSPQTSYSGPSPAHSLCRNCWNTAPATEQTPAPPLAHAH